MAEIEKRGTSYRVRWNRPGPNSGGRDRQNTTWPDLPTALQAAAVVKAHGHRLTKQELEDLILGPPEAADTSPCPLLRDWVREWLESKTRTAPGTIGSYESMMLTRILPFLPDGKTALGDRPMDRITGMDIGRLIHDLRTAPAPKAPNGMREGRVTRYFAVLHACYEAAIRTQRHTFVTSNPCDETDFVRNQRAHDDDGSDDPNEVALTPDQFRRLRDEFPEHYRPLLDVLAGTGQRWSEATAAAGDCVDQSPASGGEPMVRIVRAWKRNRTGAGRYLGTTKGKRKRSVPVPAWLMPTLKELAEANGRSVHVVPAPSGKQTRTTFLLLAPGGKPYSYRNFLNRVWNPAMLRAMRCPDHPPTDRAQPVPPGEPDRGPLCGDYGGVRTAQRGKRGHPGGPCGAKRLPGLTRCHWHAGPEPDAVSTCGCPGRLSARLTPHGLRRTYASWFLAGGGLMRVLQELLGHESITTTELYCRGLQPGSVEGAAAILDQVWHAG